MPVERLGNRDDLLNEANFKEDPSASNRIWIAGKPLEEWIEAKVGASRCTSVCGDSDCRTVEVDKRGVQCRVVSHGSQCGLDLTAREAVRHTPRKGEKRVSGR